MYKIIDYVQLAKTFQFPDDDKNTNTNTKLRLKHTSGNKYKILPYLTSDNEIDSFMGVIGEFSRTVTGKKDTTLEKEQLIHEISSKAVSHNKQDTLSSVIKELFFNENNELVIAHPAFFNYVLSSKQEASLGEFLADILVTDELKEAIRKRYNKEPENVILKLVYKSLPSLEKRNKKSDSYQLYIKNIRNQFEHDLSFLLENEKLFISHFKDLLLYYYFYYITQLTLRLDQFFDEEKLVYQVYYHLDLEKKRTKSRKSYYEGWKIIEARIPRLFAHVNCLQIINCLQNTNEFMSYQGLRNLIEGLNKEDKDQLCLEMQVLVKEYQERIQDVSWDEYKPKDNRYDEPIFNYVRSLFYQIDYQFKNSGRKHRAIDFYKGFETFAKQYFLKQSGPSGYTLNLKQDFFIFLTKLCINKCEKIALKDLFNEFEKRGIYFDRDSRKSIIELYEKLNILEKKSDSGDAQYVKYIL
ncbi:DNA phosphorothioation-dependent restriction protein DptG [Bacillus toyonensis]|uniref:DNA phosphorothioation-dependent restriction protein DptG n=2 Tax=Bacillus toyonensis TaxID=155322 RepID=UPI0012FA4D8D|nr:DNA phosphorothioation-dependent restriction protein DptG [Bacillus toyonensis]HDR7537284.1 DNA phosphorothioation-dependent restriction protein DptG [Bacillus toyonensis]